MTCSQWFKLLLDAKTQMGDFGDPLLERSTGSALMQLPNGKTSLEVTMDFLSKIYDHVFECLQGVIGKMAVEHTSIRFVITLPATWSLAARQATRQAAREAGFGSRERDDVVLIDEPEAAAVCAIKYTVATSKSSPFQVSERTWPREHPAKDHQPQTCATILDLGGGTIDLCTYRIISIDPLKLEEACVGQGMFHRKPPSSKQL